MYREFSFITVLIFSFMTCGIYGIYFMYCIAEDRNKMSDETGDVKGMSYLLAYIISVFTCGIFMYVWYYKYWNQTVLLAQHKGIKVTPSESPVVLVLLSLIPIYNCYMLCDSSNMLADAYRE